MAFAAIGAIVAGAEITAGIALAAVAEIGTVMSVVGAVTGSKDLMKIGGIMGLVGGVGALATGGFAEAGAAAASSGASNVAGVGEAGWGMDLGTDAVDGIVTGGADAVSGALPQPSSSMPEVAPLAPNPTDMRLAANTQAAEAPMGMAPSPADTFGAQAPQGPAGAQAPNTPYDRNPTDIRLANGTQRTPTAPTNTKSFFGGIMDFANNNKTLFQGGMQLLGGALKGMNDASMWSDRLAIEQQKVNQTSHGNEVAQFYPGSIVSGARA